MRKEALVPLAILFAGALLAYTVYTLRHHEAPIKETNPAAVRPVNTTDHVLGNPSAPVVIVEYADIDSEFSKNFQTVMQQIMLDYGPTGKVAWVYRHIPREGDENSEQNAEAAECVGALGGTNNFFKFIDAVQTAAPGDNQFDPAGYDQVVSALGISSGTFDSCLAAHSYQKSVASDYANAAAVGANSVPFSVLLVKGQPPTTISGYLGYTAMKAVVDTSLNKALAQ